MISPYKPIEEILLEQEKQKKADTVFEALQALSEHKQSLVKTASNGKMTIGDFIERFGLSSKISFDEIGELKEAKKQIVNDNKDKEVITIISKEIKDPHYEIYIEIADMEKSDIDITTLSFYCKEAYLGRYLIKRDAYFLRKNKKEAIKAMRNLVQAINDIKQEYYDGNMICGEVSKALHNIAQAQTGDFTFKKEESIGTTVSRRHLNESEVYQWFYRNKEKADEIRKTAMGPAQI